jgi:large subunit ribosomal protein L9
LGLGVVAIPAHAGNEGKLFGSVTSGDIAAAVVAAGVEITKREVRLDHGSLREVGDYEVVIHLHPEVEVNIAIAIVPSE